MKNLLAHFRRRRGAPMPAYVDIQSPERLHFTLIRERMRSDRSGLSFSFLSISGPRPHRNPGQDWVAKIISRSIDRIRITDEIGRLDDQTVGIVLPQTSAAGAWKLAADIRRLVPSEEPALRFEVYVYSPDPPDDESHDQRHEDSGSPCGPTEPMDRWFQHPIPRSKRALDVVVATCALVVLSPFLLIVATLVKVTSPGPILFSQWRAGLGGRPFRIFKFRTMYDGAEKEQSLLRQYSEQDGPAFKLRNDPRVTPLGRILRWTSIDEFPQLWNVLRGEMSMVGPRPLPCAESNGCRNWLRRRLDITPGITCLWQVDARSRSRFEDWVRMDIRYLDSQSTLRDVHLLLRTVPAVLSGRGAC